MSLQARLSPSWAAFARGELAMQRTDDAWHRDWSVVAGVGARW